MAVFIKSGEKFNTTSEYLYPTAHFSNIKMKEYFILQYRMNKRRFKDAGIEPVVGYLLTGILFIGLSFALFMKTEFAQYIYVLSALTLISNLSETNRTEFLSLSFSNALLSKIRIAENIITALPFLVFLLYKQFYFASLILIVLAFALAFTRLRSSLKFTIPTPFSKKPFEFSCGFRNTFQLLVIVYILGVIAISVNNFNLGIFSLLMVFIASLSFYTKPEHEFYVWSYRLKARQFLFEKIKTALFFSAVLASPLVAALLIFYPENFMTVSVLFLTGWIYLISMILAKYASYPKEIDIMQAVILALSVWMPPVLLLAIPYLFKKSENRLNGLLK